MKLMGHFLLLDCYIVLESLKSLLVVENRRIALKACLIILSLEHKALA